MSVLYKRPLVVPPKECFNVIQRIIVDVMWASNFHNLLEERKEMKKKNKIKIKFKLKRFIKYERNNFNRK